MKRMKITALLPIIATLFLLSCTGAKDYLIESDYSYSGKFKKYKTFTFVKQAAADRDPSIFNSIIEDAVTYRMKLQGYKFTESKPNLLVSYRLFFDDFGFMGYNQPNIESWARTENEDEEYNPVDYDLRRGTLLVLLHDRKKRKVIWQGYASGVFGNRDFNNERYLKRAVRSIFDQYRFFADGYMVNNAKLK